MKKLMLASAIALGAMATFAIESQTVGYIDTAMRNGFSLIVPAFNDVGSEGMSIQTIQPKGSGLVAGGKIQLQTFDEGAGASEMFYWMTEEDDEVEDGDGWYDAGGTTKKTKVLAKGEGLMASLPNANVTLSVAGEVNVEEQTIPFRAGFTLSGNFRPCNYSIQSIQPVGTGVVAGGKIQLQTFTDGAGADEMFYWMTEEDDEVEDGDGWYDAGGTTKKTKEFTPGEGFMASMPNANVSLKFLAPSIK